jgi:hypothetical protein
VVAADSEAMNPDGNLNGQTPAQFAAAMLMLAWDNVVRRIIPTFPNLSDEAKRDYALAAELKRIESPSWCDDDPICASPGLKAPIAKIGDKEAVCVTYLMAGALPLSAQYVWRLRELREQSAKLAEAEKKVGA